MKNSMFKGIEECLDYYNELRKGAHFGRLGKVFSTEQNYYFFDTGTGKIARVKENVYQVLKYLLESETVEGILQIDLSEKQILEAFDEIRSGVEAEYILSAKPVKKFTGNAILHLEEMLKQEAQNVTLEVTQKCNLRCKYCIYHPEHPSFREFGHRDMDWDMAKRAIDLLYEHSAMQDTVYVGFYGGEPLMNYSLVRNSVSYAKERFQGKAIVFSMTTNGTLITKEIAEYLAENNFALTLSVDGPEEIHDQNRCYVDGRGSFADVKKGILHLLDAYDKYEKEKSLLFNVVTSGPDFSEQYARIERFINKTEWLPESVSIVTNTVDQGPTEHVHIRSNSPEEREFLKEVRQPVFEWVVGKKKDEIDTQTFADGTLEKELLLIHNRILVSKPADVYGMHGCCVPGHRRIYVTVDGELYPCEKVGNIPSLGNIWEGFDYPKIKKYFVDDYIEESKKYCGDCWAANLCSICYVDCYDEKGIRYDFRHTKCAHERLCLENALKMYHHILEHNPEKIAELSEIEVS